MAEFDVLIVGGGHAGAQVAAGLRQQKFAGSIALISDESVPPYERPPLSKEYFAGEKDFDRILLRPDGFWEAQGIDLLLNTRVERVDSKAKTIKTADDIELSFGRLVWATGGSARRLPVPGGDFENVLCIRTKKDADSLKAAASTAANVVVIGGGYIGLEAAAVLTKLRKKVTVIETQDRLLSRVAGAEIAKFYRDYHEAKGVTFRFTTQVSAIEGDNLASGVRLATGEVLPAELVVVGIGIIPSVGPLLDAGASGGNGVDIDAFGQTSLPDIYSIGDCAAHENAFAQGKWIRLESVQNANDMGRTVVKHLSGRQDPYNAVPWFWSDQYDLKLQTVGLSLDYDQTVLRGNPDEATFAVAYLRKGRVIALDCVNSPADYAQGRVLIATDVHPDIGALADPAVPLKSFLT